MTREDLEIERLLEAYYISLGKKDAIIAEILKGLYPCQRKFVNSKSKRKSALCPRQTGKTFTFISYLAKAAIENDNPDARIIYSCDTRDHAKDIVWGRLLRSFEDWGIQYKANRVELSLELENGVLVDLFGLDDERKASKLRGLQIKLLIIDEVKDIKPEHLKVVINEDVSAALKTYGGTLVLAGTPGPVNEGFFYEVTTNPKKYGFDFYTWNQYDNVDYPVWKDIPKQFQKEAIDNFLKQIAEEEFGGWDNPAFQREYLGRWVQDADAFCYHLSEEKNLLSEPSELAMQNCIIGVDLGVNDKTAFTVLGYDQKLGQVQLLSEVARSGMIVDDVAVELISLIGHFKPMRVVMDTGGLGAMVTGQIAREVSRRFVIPIDPADKSKKAAYMLMLDNDFRAGRVKLPKRETWSQFVALKKNPKKQIEEEGQQCDLCDAFLYAWRDCLHFIKEVEKQQPKQSDDPYRDWILSRCRVG